MATNLELITSQAIPYNVSNVDITNVFSDKYDKYKVVISGVTTIGTTATSCQLRVIQSDGSVRSTLSYAYGYRQLKGNTTYAEQRATNATEINRVAVADKPDAGNCVMYIYQPYDSATYTFFAWQVSNYFNSNLEGIKGIAYSGVAETITGFRFQEIATSPFSGGQISVYGVRV